MVVCKYYQSGFCRFGDRCRFEHVDRVVNYPSGPNNSRFPDQYANRFPGPNYINNQAAAVAAHAAAVASGAGSGYTQRGSMLISKKPDQYHYIANYDRQYQASGGHSSGGQSFNQSRLGHGHGASHTGGSTGGGGSGGGSHSSHHHHHHHQSQQQQQQQPQQQHGIMPVQYWQVQRHQQLHGQQPAHHHQQSHQTNQRQTQGGHHHGHGLNQHVDGQHQSSQHHHSSGNGQQHGQHYQQQSTGFSFNQKLKEIETSQKPQVGFSFNRALQQIQYQPHLAQQAQNQYYLTPTPMLTVPVQTPYYGVSMPMPMAPNPLAPMFSPAMLQSNTGDPKMISSYLPQQQSTPAKISMNLSDDDSGIYSIMSSLTQEELNQYKADKFTFPHIPMNPPPKELCL